MSKQLVKKPTKTASQPKKKPQKRAELLKILHVANVRQPWLKVAVAILFAGGVIGSMVAIWHHDVEQPVGTPTEVESESAKDPEISQELPEVSAANQPVKGDPTVGKSTQPQSVTGKKLVALTFDDGPSVAQTPRLLQILREKNVKVTFFVVGTMARKAPEILRQEETEGHEVASHTMTHADLQRSTVEGIKWEVAAMNGLFMEILGHGARLTRPPYGNVNNNVRTYVNQPLVLWTVDPEDWRYRNPTAVHQRVVQATFDGAIVLLHDIHGTTVDAVAGIIDDLRAAGYEFVTVSELAVARGIILQNGAVYGGFRP